MARGRGGRPLPREADGIAHHYCKLALLQVANNKKITVLEDCRDRFPSLTGICAEDICVDDGFCEFPGVHTVQDALDVLCEESTLRRHKQHLHGWGIVCGLQVECAPPTTDPETEGSVHEDVTVKEGYAIDSEGNDVWADKDQTIAVLDLIARHDSDADPLLNGDGDGEVCLTIALDPDGVGHSFAVEPYDPNWNTTESLLAGTLLKSFYDECVMPVVEFLRKELTSPPELEGAPTTPAFQRESILAGLLAQVLNPSAQTIHISAREDKLLRGFYGELREMLQSQTFCAMFDTARPFPAYPDDIEIFDTIFGRGHHLRLRLRPNPKGAKEAYTVGPGANPLKPSTLINRYDLSTHELVSRLDPIAGEVTNDGTTDSGSNEVADVAFSPDGKRIYMIAPTRDNENTFFRAGDISSDGVKWGSLVMLCGARLLTLATTAADPGHVYAVGEGSGLYEIDPSGPDASLPLLVDDAGTKVGEFTADRSPGDHPERRGRRNGAATGWAGRHIRRAGADRSHGSRPKRDRTRHLWIR